MPFHLPVIKEDDAALVLRYRNAGDLSVLGELFQRYTHLVFGVCLKYLKDEDESQDAVMQVFEKLIIDLKKHEVANFKSWLYAVAKNHCLMQLRARHSRMIHEQEMQKDMRAFMQSETDVHLTGAPQKEIQLTRMEEGIKQLSPEQRTCIELFYLQEKSYQEVADVTGYSLSNVKSYIQNGKRNLKLYLMNLRHEY